VVSMAPVKRTAPATVKAIYQDLTAFIDYTVRPTLTAGNGDVPKIMYPLLIQSRLAAKRSLNEFFEILFRDPLGAISWLWGIPIGQKLYIAKFTTPEVRDMLITRKKPAPLPKGAGLLTRLTHALQSSPLAWELQPSGSLKHRIELLKDVQAKLADPAILNQAIHLMEEAKIKRDFATFIGFMLTFMVLGVGINIFNVYNTKKAVEVQKKAGLSASA
jgi:hypothetical protein